MEGKLKKNEYRNVHIMNEIWFTQECSAHSTTNGEGLRATHIYVHSSNIGAPKRDNHLYLDNRIQSKGSCTEQE